MGFKMFNPRVVKVESQPVTPVIREFVCEAEEVWSENGRTEVAKEKAA